MTEFFIAASTALGLIALAELGDKTPLAVAGLASPQTPLTG